MRSIIELQLLILIVLVLSTGVSTNRLRRDAEIKVRSLRIKGGVEGHLKAHIVGGRSRDPTGTHTTCFMTSKLRRRSTPD